MQKMQETLRDDIKMNKQEKNEREKRADQAAELFLNGFH